MASNKYYKDLMNFNKFEFENTGMLFTPWKITNSGTKIWIVSFKDNRHKFSMYHNKLEDSYEFRYCDIHDNIVGNNSKKIRSINRTSFINNSNVAYELLGDVFEILA